MCFVGEEKSGNWGESVMKWLLLQVVSCLVLRKYAVVSVALARMLPT